MKKITIAQILLSLTLLNAGSITLTGACACNPAMSSAFSQIDTHIIDNNMIPIVNSLDKLIASYDTKIDKLKKESEILDKLIKTNKDEVIFLSKLAFLTQKEIQIRHNHLTRSPIVYANTHKNIHLNSKNDK